MAPSGTPLRFVILGLVGLLGCASAPPDATPLPATYETVRALFRRSCAGYCHAGGLDLGAGLVLAPDDGSAPVLVNQPSRQVPRVMLVAPGDPDASYLMRKIDGTMGALPECASRPARCGSRMPYAPDESDPVVALSAAERDAIRRWIAAGAPGAAGP